MAHISGLIVPATTLWTLDREENRNVDLTEKNLLKKTSQ